MDEGARLASPGGDTGEEPSARKRTGKGGHGTATRSAAVVPRGLAFDAYCSVAWVLHFVVAQCRFLDPGLARRVAADAAAVPPPLPAESLEEDETLEALLGTLPEELQPTDPAKWIALPVDRRPCLLCRLAAHEGMDLARIESLTHHLSARLAEALSAVYDLDIDHATYLAGLARDEAVARAIERAPMERIEAYLEEMAKHGQLGGDRLIAYAQRGDSPLFVAAVAQCAAMDSMLIEAFLEDGGVVILERMLLRTDLVPALRAAICNAYEEATRASA